MQFEETDVIKKEAKRFLKYKYFTMEVQRMRDVKTKIIIMGAIGSTGTISKSSLKHLSNITGKGDIERLPPAATLDITCAVNCNYTIVATL